MRIIRGALIFICLLAAFVFAWLWWTRPVRVDMAAYVPADSIVYIEADSLQNIFDAVTSTDDWKELAPAAGVEIKRGSGDWLTSFMSFTGMGPSDAVVLSRAQIAVAVLGFEAVEESDGALNYKPRAALVAETHTSEWRVKSAVEKLVGDFARRSFGAGVVERKEVDGVPFFVWAEQGGEHRKIVAAVYESVVVVGKDESVVQACLDVRRGARPGLADNEQLKEMRVRLSSDGALAFGFAPQGSAAKVVEVFAPAFVGGVSQDTKVQSLLATVLPQMINQTLGSVGWSSRAAGGRIEDHYFLALPGDMQQRLQTPLAPSDTQGGGAAGLLPQETHQFTRYDFRSPEAAWRGLGAVLSTQVDVSRATLITLALEALLKPYGVEHPRDFLRACGAEVATATLDATSEGKVLVASVRDRDALLAQVRAHLGRAARTVRVGDAELLVSTDPELGAASFVGDYLVMGSEDDVRRCVAAHAARRTLQDTAAFKASAQNFFDGPTFALTLTDDRDSAHSVFNYLARRGDAHASDQGALEDALARRGYSVGETRLADGGFEKKTRSAFGLFGEIVTRFAPR
ncbi:MAG: hypothetical protein DMF65_10695 [Acidobacteria bacterium]|nr:MAG: hypothetical protein DMF65_10695 [Acidobacteriota bacterium]